MATGGGIVAARRVVLADRRAAADTRPALPARRVPAGGPGAAAAGIATGVLAKAVRIPSFTVVAAAADLLSTRGPCTDEVEVRGPVT